MPIKASDIPFSGNLHAQIQEKHFRERGEQRYSLEILPIGITFEVDHLRRDRHELVGELQVSVNGNFSSAKTVDGILSVGDFNFSSVQARSTRSKLLAERSDHPELDWYGFLEEFGIKTIKAERTGRPSMILADAELPDESKATWSVGGLPLLRDLPMIIYADASAGKSYIAMWIAGQLAEQGIPVIYADWEFSINEHRKRLGRLFQPMPKTVHYVRCERPLKDEAERLSRLTREHQCGYMVLDSVGFALDGPAESQESASSYFRHLRSLRVGTLSLAHIPKQYDDNREATVFGSIFFKAGARSVWFMDRATRNPADQLRIGMYHRKSNVGELLPARGYALTFSGERTLVTDLDISTVDELVAQLPLLDRMKQLLFDEGQAMTAKQISEDLNCHIAAVRGTYARFKNMFLKLGNKIMVKADGELF